MRSRIAVLVALVAAFVLPSTLAEGEAEPAPPTTTIEVTTGPPICKGHQYGATAFRKVARKVYDPRTWRDATPAGKGERRQMRILKKCAVSPAARKQMRVIQDRQHQQHEQHYQDLIDPPGPEWLASTRACESGTSGGYQAVSPNGLYRGAYQFDHDSWIAAGGHGDPVDAAPREQDYRAAIWHQMAGPDAWPVCG